MNGRYDAVVVGARCAGASTAMLLARAGLDVLAIDRDAEGTDTLSTHVLMRGGVLQLTRWGLVEAIESAGTPALRRATFHYGDEVIPVPIQPKDGVDALYAPRRTVLDPLLVRAARVSGAEVAHETSVIDLVRDGDGRVRGVVVETRDGSRATVRSDLVIGADGLRSRVARLVGADVERSARHGAAVIYRYFDGFAVDGLHWHYRRGTSVGLIPTNDGRVCVFAAMPADRFRRELATGLESLHRRVLLETSPGLERAVDAATPVGRPWPFPGTPGFLRRAWGPGWALVGDAGFFRDPITAHGITDALRDAELLSRAVQRGGDSALADYQTERDRVAKGILEVSDEIASFAWNLDEAKLLHKRLSRLMQTEVDTLREIAAQPRSSSSAASAASTSGFASASRFRAGRP